ncbi:MAG: PA0069 family radical SAM protein [Planctomycetaceae bacterium]|nr:PA0069 family radical SAM protein [Planctomycetales bacterium]MCB9875011.1 PA0069 family radical SAM protein [Planctomycetaceae bacterium]
MRSLSQRVAILADTKPSGPKGRGSWISPKNRFERCSSSEDLAHVAEDDDFFSERRSVKTVYLHDDTQSIVSENNSPDIPFRYSVNPYRGCAHGCSYCYARPTHEYLGMNAGIDFESKILVKHRAPGLLRDWLARPKYRPELIVFSGVTDCYQPAEHEYQLTRGCLQVALEAGQPVGIITKNALLTRDLDLLRELAARNLVSVSMSITTLDSQLARGMEPRTSSPPARLRTIAELREAGVPVSVMVAPVIPGLNDIEIPNILAAASEAGAMTASYTMLRLPLAVREVFLEWLERTQPDASSRVTSRIRSVRDGQLSNSQFGNRMRGEGVIADQIAQTFRVFAKKYHLDGERLVLDTSQFLRPRNSSGQLHLF